VAEEANYSGNKFHKSGKHFALSTGNPIPIQIPLLGHMGMDKASMDALHVTMYGKAQDNEEQLDESGLKKPKTGMWNEKQIAALIANELLHGMAACGQYQYSTQFGAVNIPDLHFSNGAGVWDFFRSLPKDRQYTDATSADAIMHTIYYAQSDD